MNRLDFLLKYAFPNERKIHLYRKEHPEEFEMATRKPPRVIADHGSMSRLTKSLCRSFDSSTSPRSIGDSAILAVSIDNASIHGFATARDQKNNTIDNYDISLADLVAKPSTVNTSYDFGPGKSLFTSDTIQHRTDSELSHFA